jgi:general secretion pathway protein A
MYEKFFYLKENPFHITPDPKFFYPSKNHQEAIDILLFGILRKKGFLLLDGEVGTGKTIIWRTILNKLNGAVESALILNPLLSDIDLLKTINEDFGIRLKSNSMKEHLDALNAFLLEKAYKGGNAVVIIDEAQNLNPKALEMIRLLSNLETAEMKLLQIILIGQPELRNKLLKMPELRQLNQRILLRYHLKPLDVNETREYIFNRLNIAGGKGNVKFTPQAIQIIYTTCKGTPRMINTFCDRALTAAFVDGKRIINRDIANRVKNELNAEGAIKKEIDIDIPKVGNGITRYTRFLVQPVRMLRQ